MRRLFQGLALLALLPQLPFIVPRSRTALRAMPGGPPMPSSPLGVPWCEAPAAVTVELFLDLCGPFSKCMLLTTQAVAAAYEGRVCFIFHSVVQPWHAQSSHMHEACLAVLKLHGPKEFWRYAVPQAKKCTTAGGLETPCGREAALFERQEDFFDDKAGRVLKWKLAHGHMPFCGTWPCGREVFEKSRHEIYKAGHSRNCLEFTFRACTSSDSGPHGPGPRARLGR